MIGLDDSSAMAALDSRRMLQQVGDFPRRIVAGFQQAARLSLPPDLRGRQDRSDRNDTYRGAETTHGRGLKVLRRAPVPWSYPG